MTLRRAIPEKFNYASKQLEDASTFFDAYFTFSAVTEVPIIYNRWTSLAAISAILGKSYFLPFGRGRIYPNIYCMLIGVPGARKSSAIKDMVRTLRAAQYETIAAAKTSKEQFLADLQYGGADVELEEKGQVVMREMFGEDAELCDESPLLIAADEFNNFIGAGNLEFISLLGELYDFEGIYKYRLRNGKSIRVPNPIITICAGNTHESFVECFPPETLGQGFLSRLLLIYGDKTAKKISWPKIPEEGAEATLVSWFGKIKSTVSGAAHVDTDASGILSSIYESWPLLEDSRFKHYSHRRHTQLLKLCLLVSAARLSTTITKEDVILSNSILTYTEQLMPKALGEFGKSRSSSAGSKILEALYESQRPMQIKELYKVVSHEIDKFKDLGPILEGLAQAEKILVTPVGITAIQPKSLAHNKWVDFDLLPEAYLE